MSTCSANSKVQFASLLTYLLPSTRVDKNYSTPIWSRVLALLELIGTALVTRSRARECQGVNIVPEAQIELETETRTEPEIPAPQVSITTCEGGLEAATPSTIEIASS